jgi:Coenzyme PQQ synthesis protein D (PqqD)
MRLSPNIRTSFNQDGAVLMDIQGGSMLTLNPIGSIIWRQLGEGRSPEQIAGDIGSEFGIPPEQVLVDVNEFLEQLKAQHLIVPSDPEVSRVNSGSRLTGLFCNLFGKRDAPERQDHRSK